MGKWRIIYGLIHLDAKLTLHLSGATTTLFFKFDNKNEQYWIIKSNSDILTFRELESFTSFLLTEFLTLYHSRIPC